jgi:toxin ParE1/3/4
VYLDAQRSGVGERFAKRTIATFDTPANHPGIGAPMKFRRVPLAGVRRWPVRGFERYLVFYIPREREIEILRVLHGAMNVRRRILRDERR